MPFASPLRSLLALAALSLLFPLSARQALAQTSGFPPAPPVRIAVNPLTNKVYAVNEAADSVTVLDVASHTTTAVPVGPRPQFIAVNPATNRVYVVNGGDSTLTVIDGATDTNITPTAFTVGSTGPISVNPVTNTVYIVRLTGTGSDEVTFFNATSSTWYTIATQSFQPISMGVNPATNTIYVAHYSTGDLRVISGAFDPNNDFPATFSIGTGSHPFAVAVNPVTNKVYAITQNPSTPIVVVDGASRTAAFPTPASGHAQTPKGIAANTVTNRIYAAFAGEVVVIDGSTNALSYVPVDTGTGPASLGINAATNRIYVAADDGVLSVIDGDTNVVATSAIPAGADGIGVNPVTNQAFVHGSDTTVVDGSASDTARANPLRTSISPLPGNASGPDATFTLSAANSFSPNALPVRAVYYQLDSTAGRWSAAQGSGPYTAAFTGLAPGSHTLRAFAVDGQDAPLSAGPQSIPLVGTVAAYAFTVSRAGASVSLAASRNPVDAGDTVTFTANVTASGATPTGSVAFLDGSSEMACSPASLSAGSAACAIATLAAGSHSITARYSGDAAYAPAGSSAIVETVQSAPPPSGQATLSPTALAFGGESMGTTSPTQAITVTNTGSATLTISAIAVSDGQFAQSNDCGALAPGASCTVTVAFHPAAAAGDLDSTVSVSATLTVGNDGAGGMATAGLSGTAEKSLVTHYYRAILRRPPDASGKPFWEGEAARVAGLGANVNEAWFAMAQTFYGSAEYAAFGRDDAGFVVDLYETFFNRAPDADGFRFWTGEIAAGLPRDGALLSFMFSTEFVNFTRSIFGNAAARAEVDTVGDFYRGVLGRLPDSGGFDFWVGQFRTAQCQGASAVAAAADAISSAFANSAEYSARARTNVQYVDDLYNAFLRRGPDRPGVRFWVGQLDSGALTREDLRRQFVASPEFANRVNAIVSQGCMQ
jgi:YVTN family beta-propeller protein